MAPGLSSFCRSGAGKQSRPVGRRDSRPEILAIQIGRPRVGTDETRIDTLDKSANSGRPLEHDGRAGRLRPASGAVGAGSSPAGGATYFSHGIGDCPPETSLLTSEVSAPPGPRVPSGRQPGPMPRLPGLRGGVLITRARTIEGMQLLSTLCSFVEYSQGWSRRRSGRRADRGFFELRWWLCGERQISTGIAAICGLSSPGQRPYLRERRTTHGRRHDT